jgi:hypothetical protein
LVGQEAEEHAESHDCVVLWVEFEFGHGHLVSIADNCEGKGDEVEVGEVDLVAASVEGVLHLLLEICAHVDGLGEFEDEV